MSDFLERLVFINLERVKVNALDITEDKTEELDFGTMTIPFSSKSENYQIGDEVKIFINDEINPVIEYDKMIVVSDKVERVSKVDEIYSHKITFVESVKRYEKILGASISITQPKFGTRYSLLDCINLVRDKVPFERTSLHASTRLFTIDTSQTAYLDSIDAPQFFFQEQSLKDMLNKIGAYINGIARMKDDNILSYTLMNEILSEALSINDKVIGKTLNADFKNFGTTLDSTVSNAVMSDDIDRGKIVFPTENSWIAPRANTFKLEDTTYEFVLEQPIEEIDFRNSEVKINVKTDKNAVDTLTEIECGSLILEKSEWDRLDLDSQLESQRHLDNYKSNTLYYEYKGTTISNNELFGIGDISNTMTSFIKRALEFNNTGDNVYYPPTEGEQEIKDFLMRITYIPYISFRTRLQKANVNDVGTNMQNKSNPSGRILSGERVLKNMHGGIERLGNDEILIKKFGTKLDELLELGDYFIENNSTFILAKRKISFNIYSYYVEYEFTRNFNRLSSRIEIDKEDRPYEVTINKQKVDRKEIYEEYVEMDVVPKTNDSLVGPFGSETFINAFRSNRSLGRVLGGNDILIGRNAPGFGANQSLELGIVKSPEMVDTLLQSDATGVARVLNSVGEGNSLAFTWEFDDIRSAGKRIVEDTLLENTIPITLNVNNNIIYTDNVGELDTLKVGFYKKAQYGTNVDAQQYPLITIPDNASIGGFGKTLLESNDSFKVVKDRSETLGMTYQLHVVPHYQWVDAFVIGNEFIKNNNLIHEIEEDIPLYVWTSDTEFYVNSTDNLLAKGSQTLSDYSIVQQGITYDDYTYSIQVDSSFTNGKASWGLADANGKLYLGVNQRIQNISEVYFNYRNKRSGVKYRFDNNPIVAETPPENPTNLTFSNLLKTGFTANWTDPSVSSDEFEYEVVRVSDSVVVDSGTQVIGTPTKIISGLTSGIEYTFKVRTRRGVLYSGYTSENITTEPPVPVAPTGGNITNIQDTSFTMNWTDNAEYEDGFRIYISDIGSSGPYDYYGSVGKNITSEGISGLTSSTTYWIRVFAYNTSEGQLQESTTYTEASATTDSPAPPPTTSPLIFGVSSDNENIYFFLQNQDDDIVTLRYEVNDSTPDIVLGVANSGQNLGGSVGGLNPDTTYTLYATAQASGESVSSASSYSQKTTAVPIAPSGLSLTFIDEGGGQGVIQADWTNEANYMDGYLVELYDDAGYTNRIDQVSYSSSTVETHTFSTTVFTGNTYYARVASKYNFQVSSWVNANITI